MHFSSLYLTLWPVNQQVNCFCTHSINCTSHVFLILTTTFCQKCPISRINIARVPHIPRNVFGFYEGFILCHFKNLKDISCKGSQLSIFRLWFFGLNSSLKVLQQHRHGLKRCISLHFLTFYGQSPKQRVGTPKFLVSESISTF